MAYANTYYTGDASTKTFTFSFPYLSTDHVKAYVNGASAAFSFSGSGQITLNSTPAKGDVVLIRRETPVASPLVTFSNGSSVQGGDLNNAILQELYGLQEADDRVADITGSYTTELNARTAADAAEAKARSDADTAEANARVAAINSEANTRASADSAASGRLDSLESKVQTLQNNSGSVSNQSYTAQNGGVARNVALKLNDNPDLRDYGAAGGGTADASAAFAAALSALSKVGGGTLTIGEVYLLAPSGATTYTVPANVRLDFTPTGRLKTSSTASLVIAGIIRADATQIFDTATAGTVTASTTCLTPVVLPEWWGAKPGTGTDCQPAVQAAQKFSEAYGGTLRFRGLVYAMKSSLIVNATSVIEGAGLATAGFRGNETVLDFTSAPTGSSGLIVNSSTSATLFAPRFSGLSIARSQVAAGSGGYGIVCTAVYKGVFEGIGVDGFDSLLLEQQNTSNPCLSNIYDSCVFGSYATRSIWCVSATASQFRECEINSAASGQEVVLIGGGGNNLVCDTISFYHSRLGNVGYAPVIVRIISGLYHMIRDCDVETATQAGIAIGMGYVPDNMSSIVTIDNCWFDNCGMNVYCYGYVGSFSVTNNRRMLAEAPVTRDGRNVAGSPACVYIDDQGATNRDVDIIISGNNMRAARSDASCVKAYHCNGIQITNNKLVQYMDALNNPPVIIGGNVSIVTNNRLHSTKSIQDNGTSNVTSPNIYS